jgi:hypothetical protein
MTRVLLVSTYEQGHQPLGLAAPAAYLRARGHEVRCLDIAVQQPDPDRFRDVDLIAISVPMHTAARLAMALARRLRQLVDAPIAFYGLYASELDEQLRSSGLADAVFGGEYEIGLGHLADAVANGEPVDALSGSGSLPLFPRQDYLLPDRAGLPALDEYARFDPGDGELRLAGYVEATRGCAHRCTHCPLTPTYGGRLRLVQPEVVLADIDQLVALGAQHITFGDPDFLNAAGHAGQITADLHARHPDLSFDATIKVEHLIRHEALLAPLKDRGLAFVTSAFESVDDALLERLEKGHTRADMETVMDDARRHGVPLRPTWLPFTPWTAAQDYLDILTFVADHGLVDHVQPVQYALRLLLPPGSPLIAQAEADGALTGFDADGLTHSWAHPDPAMDELQRSLAAYTSQAAAACDHEDDFLSTGQQFAAIRATAVEALGGVGPSGNGVDRVSRGVPGLTEDWFC